MLAKILVIEDNRDQADLIKFQLQQASYEVQVAHEGAEGLRLAYQWQPHLIILDIMLPVMSGWTVCERLRQLTDAPIIFLTVLEQEYNIVRGLKMGGDDYLVKPYDARELLARIAATLRRRTLQIPPPTGIFVYDDLTIDFERRTIKRAEKNITLTPLEYRLLLCLAEKPGENLSHEYLLHRVWGESRASRPSLKLYIHYLRRKLEKESSKPKILLSEHSVGYRLCRPDRID